MITTISFNLYMTLYDYRGSNMILYDYQDFCMMSNPGSRRTDINVIDAGFYEEQINRHDFLIFLNQSNQYVKIILVISDLGTTAYKLLERSSCSYFSGTRRFATFKLK